MTTPPAFSAPPPVAKVGIAMLLAAEMMLFAGLLGAYVVLRGASPGLFAVHGGVPDRPLGTGGVVALAIGSAVMATAARSARAGLRDRTARALGGAVALGVGFLFVLGLQWHGLLSRVTAIAIDPATGVQHVYDGVLRASAAGGLTIDGRRVPVDALPNADVFRIGPRDLAGATDDGVAPAWRAHDVPAARATVVRYGPWKNVVYACHYTLTGVLAAHVAVATAVAAASMARARRGTLSPVAADCAAAYWHFVAAAAVVVAIALYWV